MNIIKLRRSIPFKNIKPEQLNNEVVSYFQEFKGSSGYIVNGKMIPVEWYEQMLAVDNVVRK